MPILDDSARENAPGAFTDLPHGKVHYELSGAHTDPTIVFIHGFSVPSYTWDNNIGPLVEAGFRTLRFDLYGRGYSDRPEIPYTLEDYVAQISDLINDLDINTPCCLVGHALGGLLAAKFAVKYPTRVQRIGLISPLGFYIDIPPNQKQMLKAPLIGKRMIKRVFNPRRLQTQTLDDLYNPESNKDYKDKFSQQVLYDGFDRAVYATARHLLDTDMRTPYQDLANTKIPVMAIWGREDLILPLRFSEKLQGVIPHLVIRSIVDAGHASHYEQPDKVNNAITQFFQRDRP